MSEELTRDQVEQTLRQFQAVHDCPATCSHDLRPILATDAALRAKAEALEQDKRDMQYLISELQAQLAAMKQERDGLERKVVDLCHAHGSALIEIHDLKKERDRLKEALSMAEVFLLQNRGIGLLWNGPQELALCTMQAALRGETGGG